MLNRTSYKMAVSGLFFLAACTLIPNIAYSGKSIPEQTADIVQLSLPISSYLSTFVINDKEGRNQFYKSFFTNLGVTYALKYSVNDKRPEGHGCCSWPSGHTSVSFQSATFIYRRYGYKFGVPAYILASFVGWSRVEGEADMHKPDDVVAGMIIGSLSSYIFTSKYKSINIVPETKNNYIGVSFEYKL